LGAFGARAIEVPWGDDDTDRVCGIRIAKAPAVAIANDRPHTETHRVNADDNILRVDLHGTDQRFLFSIYIRDPHHKIWMSVPGPLMQLSVSDRDVLDRLVFVQRTLELKNQYVQVDIRHNLIEKTYRPGSLHWKGDHDADGWEGKTRILLDIGEDVEEDFNMAAAGAFGELFYTAYYQYLFDSGSGLDGLWQNYVRTAVQRTRERNFAETYNGLSREEQVRRFFYYRIVWMKKLAFFETWRRYIQHEFAHYVTHEPGDLPRLSTPTPQKTFEEDFAAFYGFNPLLVHYLWHYPLMDGIDLAWNNPPPVPRRLTFGGPEVFPDRARD